AAIIRVSSTKRTAYIENNLPIQGRAASFSASAVAVCSCRDPRSSLLTVDCNRRMGLRRAFPSHQQRSHTSPKVAAGRRGPTTRSFPCARLSWRSPRGECRANANGDVLPERGREQRHFSASAVERGLTNHPLVTRPVGRPHHFLVHLAYGRQRQLANEFDTLGRMRWPFPFFDELHEALRSGTRTRFRYNKCADGFAPFGIRD